MELGRFAEDALKLKVDIAFKGRNTYFWVKKGWLDKAVFGLTWGWDSNEIRSFILDMDYAPDIPVCHPRQDATKL